MLGLHAKIHKEQDAIVYKEKHAKVNKEQDARTYQE